MPDDTREKPNEQIAATAADLEEGLRFVHIMAMQGRLATERLEALMAVLLERLEEAGLVDQRSITERLDSVKKVVRQRLQKEPHVEVAKTEDKYQVQEADIDCASRMPICKGRCCQLHFPLSFQDLDEGVVRWDYSHPYRIRQRDDDKRCVHNDRETHGCTIYENRPGVCRSYTCKDDPRIWLDFEARIPAPMSAIRDQPLVIERIGVRRPARPDPVDPGAESSGSDPGEDGEGR